MEWLGKKKIPFVIIYTKIDKLPSSKLTENLNNYKSEMLNSWEEIPQTFRSSAQNGTGKSEILKFIHLTNLALKKGF